MSAHYLEDEDRALAARFGASRYVSRTAGFDAVVRAVLDAIDSPACRARRARLRDELQADYLRRIAHQLERQASIGAGLARQVSLQATALSVLDSLSDSLSRQLDPESALGDTLAECLDAAGLSVGAILLCEASDQLDGQGARRIGDPAGLGAHTPRSSCGRSTGGLLDPVGRGGRRGRLARRPRRGVGPRRSHRRA